MRFLVFFSIVLGIWLVFHLYVGWRLWSLPVFANPTGHRILVYGLAALYLSYPLGRFLYHHGMPRVGTALEYGGGVWMGTLVLLISALGAVDVLTLFGLLLKPWVWQMRAAAIIVALALAAFVAASLVFAMFAAFLMTVFAALVAAVAGPVVAGGQDQGRGSRRSEHRCQ